MLKQRRYGSCNYFSYFLWLCLVIPSPVSASSTIKNHKKPAVVTKIKAVPPAKPALSAKKNRVKQENDKRLALVKSLSVKKIVVAIDAGHGGKDPGAVGPTGLQEKQVTLAIARRLAALLLQDKQFTPILIRTHDQFIPVGERSTLACQQRAQLLVSIHADGAINRQARGASVWVLSNQRAHRVVGHWLTQSQPLPLSLKKIMPAAQNSGDYHVQHALLDLQFGYSQQVGYQVASSILGELSSITPLHKRTPEYASLGVLQSLDIPSLLVESGFITHPIEERLLRKTHHQRQIARAIYQGIKRYYQLYPPSQPPPMLKQQLANIPKKYPKAPVVVKEHVVEVGETLFAIARRYRITWYYLQQHNRLTSHQLRVGQRLKIPEATQLAKQQ